MQNLPSIPSYKGIRFSQLLASDQTTKITQSVWFALFRLHTPIPSCWYCGTHMPFFPFLFIYFLIKEFQNELIFKRENWEMGFDWSEHLGGSHQILSPIRREVSTSRQKNTSNFFLCKFDIQTNIVLCLFFSSCIFPFLFFPLLFSAGSYHFLTFGFIFRRQT